MVEFGKKVVEIMDLGDGFKRKKNIEEVELRWKKMKSGVGGLAGVMVALGILLELGSCRRWIWRYGWPVEGVKESEIERIWMSNLEVRKRD